MRLVVDIVGVWTQRRSGMLEDRVSLADEIVKEYLVRRGLVNALAAFESDARCDALHGFQVWCRKIPSAL